MGQQPSYDDFLRAKAAIAPRFGGMPSLFDLLDADQPENQKLRRTA